MNNARIFKVAIFYESRERRGLGFGGLGKPRKSFFCRSKYTPSKNGDFSILSYATTFWRVFEPYGDQNTES